MSAPTIRLATPADAFVVGSYFKAGGRWSGEVERGRVQRFMGRVFALRGRAGVGG